VFEIFSPLYAVAGDMYDTLSNPREWFWGIVELLRETVVATSSAVRQFGGRLL